MSWSTAAVATTVITGRRTDAAESRRDAPEPDERGCTCQADAGGFVHVCDCRTRQHGDARTDAAGGERVDAGSHAPTTMRARWSGQRLEARTDALPQGMAARWSGQRLGSSRTDAQREPVPAAKADRWSGHRIGH